MGLFFCFFIKRICNNFIYIIMTKHIRILILILLTSSFAANIKGTVKDKDSNEPLIGANVYIEDTTMGSATDEKGTYFINNVRSCSTCNYSLKVLYIGYDEYIIQVLVDSD